MILIRPGLNKIRRPPKLLGMKTILWATLSANGNYARASAAHPPKPEATADFAMQALTYGNFIVGRRTFEAFQAQPARAGADGVAAPNPFARTTIVVVSTTLAEPNVPRAASPEGALAMLRERGHTTALLAGGEKLHNAFLERGLVDELLLNIVPTFEDEGLKILLPRGQRHDLELLGTRQLAAGIVQLHYALSRR
jgi:dihydrofolate reductase